MGLHYETKDATALPRKCLIKRNLFEEGSKKPVIRTDNGPQCNQVGYSEIIGIGMIGFFSPSFYVLNKLYEKSKIED
ncbi:hypothetical protein [Clostridium pasteurianum]|uniref:hypothetical protein n=1 Tax=Clostridium pasteurianum TaxID=1501 RepID=UPI00039A9934|nr:hypothetical protein [Clostridium pasteurianum]